MFLTDEPQFYVFELSNEKFEVVGELTQATSAIWGETYSGAATFQIWVPITETTREILKIGNVVWLDGDDVAGVIEYVNPKYDEEGAGSYEIKGRTLESLLERRYVSGTYKVTNKSVSFVMRGLVAFNVVNPTDATRVIPYVELSGDETDLGGVLASYQKTGGSVYEALEGLCENYNVGYRMRFEPISKKIVFEVYQGSDRTINGDGDSIVIFGTDMDDVISSEYLCNSQEFSNVAFVAGESENNTRTTVYVGDTSLSGFERFELYVDARDIQSEIWDDDGGETHYLTDAEYEQALRERGAEKLSEREIAESFSASLRPLSFASFLYGVDYFVGDKVTFEAENIGVTVDARVESVQAEYGDTYSLSIVVGYETPTVHERIKRVSKN